MDQAVYLPSLAEGVFDVAPAVEADRAHALQPAGGDLLGDAVRARAAGDVAGVHDAVGVEVELAAGLEHAVDLSHGLLAHGEAAVGEGAAIEGDIEAFVVPGEGGEIADAEIALEAVGLEALAGDLDGGGAAIEAGHLESLAGGEPQVVARPAAHFQDADFAAGFVARHIAIDEAHDLIEGVAVELPAIPVDILPNLVERHRLLGHLILLRATYGDGLPSIEGRLE